MENCGISRVYAALVIMCVDMHFNEASRDCPTHEEYPSVAKGRVSSLVASTRLGEVKNERLMR